MKNNDLATTFETVGDEVRIPTQDDAMQILINQDIRIRDLGKAIRRENGRATLWKNRAKAFVKANKITIKKLEGLTKLLDESERQKRAQTDIIMSLQEELDATRAELERTKAALVPRIGQQLAALTDEELDQKVREAFMKIGRTYTEEVA